MKMVLEDTIIVQWKMFVGADFIRPKPPQNNFHVPI